MLLTIAAGGAIGSVLRYWVSTSVHAFAGQGFPYGTFVVNVIGSMAMGFLFVVMLERAQSGPEMRAFLLIGLLGAFTTFSAFSMETLDLLGQGSYWKALVNMSASVVACVGAAFIGMLAGRQL